MAQNNVPPVAQDAGAARSGRCAENDGVTVSRYVTALAVVLLGLAVPLSVAAHGVVAEGPPTALNVLFGWTFEAAVVIPLLASVLAWRYAVGLVNALHPANPVPRIRSVAF